LAKAVRRSFSEGGPWQALRNSLLSEVTMHYVYLLRSDSDPYQTYIGLTDKIDARLKKHNEGGSPHTAKYKPWKLVTYVAFSTRDQAAEFESYLKSGSGRAFAKKHLW
jgi:predicted GIY-YIG superfamily endonuclease